MGVGLPGCPERYIQPLPRAWRLRELPGEWGGFWGASVPPVSVAAERGGRSWDSHRLCL